MGTLAIALPAVVVSLITAKAQATKIIAYSLVGMTSPDGIDSAHGLEDAKAQLGATGSKTFTLGGVPVTITAEDANRLTPRQLRLKIFGAFANEFYDKGARQLATNQGADAQGAAKFENDASALNLFTATTHTLVTKVTYGLLGLSALWALLVVFFSYHLGRFVSIGLVLTLVSLPGLPLSILAAKLGSEPTGTARAVSADSQLAAIGGFVSYVAPLLIGPAATVYRTALLIGLGLLGLALAGLIIRHLRPHSHK